MCFSRRQHSLQVSVWTLNRTIIGPNYDSSKIESNNVVKMCPVRLLVQNRTMVYKIIKVQRVWKNKSEKEWECSLSQEKLWKIEKKQKNHQVNHAFKMKTHIHSFEMDTRHCWLIDVAEVVPKIGFRNAEYFISNAIKKRGKNQSPAILPMFFFFLFLIILCATCIFELIEKRAMANIFGVNI